MARVIHKQIIPIINSTYIISIEQGYKFLTVQQQGGGVAIWYECTPGANKIDIEIHLVETGKEVPDGALNYLGSVQFGLNFIYIVHVYEGRII